MSERWTDLQRYVIEEHFEDYRAGRISRRELLKRVSYVTGGVAASLAALAALGCDVAAPRVVVSAPAATATRSPQVAYATPPAAATSDPVTVKPDDPRLERDGPLTLAGPDGAPLIAYQALPKRAAKAAGVLVLHENRGLTEHIRDVIRRVATAGYLGLGVDLLSRQGGAEQLAPDAYSGALANRTVEAMNADVLAAVKAIEDATADVNGRGSVGAVGFCFGGGIVWNLLVAGAALRAAVPFYGPLPSRADGLAATKAAVLAIYAEQDVRITASWSDAEPPLRKAGVPFDHVVEPGVGHAFHNDTNGPGRYGPAQAQDAWIRTIDWFRRYL